MKRKRSLMSDAEIAIKNARILYRGNLISAEIGIEDEFISCIKKVVEGDEEIDARGALVTPGFIDVHVHFRDPGDTYKEDWFSGSSAAAAGGVTVVVDQPNTKPPVLNLRSFELKRREAERKSIVDFGINVGVKGNLRELERLKERAFAFGEVFLGPSTGNLEIGYEELKRALKVLEGKKVCIHAEDGEMIRRLSHLRDERPESHSLSRPPECEILAVKKVLEISQEVHFSHISTGGALRLISGSSATCEVTPHHLLLSVKDYKKLGEFGIVNPPLRDEKDVKLLWENLHRIDILASDHAPHLPEEKEEGASGLPGVETMVPLMMSFVKRGELPLPTLLRLGCENPARIFGIEKRGKIEKGFYADLVIFEKEERRIEEGNLHSKSGWTPYEGFMALHPRVVLRRGEVIFEEGIVAPRGSGREI